jgi:hypothetical protein
VEASEVIEAPLDEGNTQASHVEVTPGVTASEAIAEAEATYVVDAPTPTES